MTCDERGHFTVSSSHISICSCLFFSSLQIYPWKKKKTVVMAKPLWEAVKGDTVNTALRGWAFNNSGEYRTGITLQPSWTWLQREVSFIKTLSPADSISASSDHLFLSWSQPAFGHRRHTKRRCCLSGIHRCQTTRSDTCWTQWPIVNKELVNCDCFMHFIQDFLGCRC